MEALENIIAYLHAVLFLLEWVADETGEEVITRYRREGQEVLAKAKELQQWAYRQGSLFEAEGENG
jgi:hypothetical protein